MNNTTLATIDLNQLNNLITRVESALAKFDSLAFDAQWFDNQNLCCPVYLKSWEKKLPELKALAVAVNQFDAEVSAVESM